MDSEQDAAKQVDAVSPRLLCRIEGTVLDPRFDLGIGAEWSEDSQVLEQDKENSGPPAKRKRLALKLKKKVPVSAPISDANLSRFPEPVDEQVVQKAKDGLKPRNTEVSTQWAVTNFKEWARQRRERVPDDPVPEDLLQSHDPTQIVKYLCLYVLETRKEDGSPYPPATLRSLLSGINRVLQANKAPFSILDKHDLRFRELFNTLDVVSSNLHREGVGAHRKSAPVISVDHENLFWERGLLGYSTPRTLQRAVFFYVGLQFALRGVQEQYDLVPSQLCRFPADTSIYDSSVFYQYTELVSKNNQHRFKDVNMQNKTGRVYAQVDSERCLVKLLDKYLLKLPEGALHFYMRPLDKIPQEESKPWFTKQRVGQNNLKEILPKLSVESGCGVRYTNHSLRATAATRMFSTGVPEKLIADKTGHRSLKALRFYERTQPSMEQAVNAVIANPECKFSGFDKVNLPEIKPLVEDDSGTEKCASSAGHTFSGTLSNCTINITYNK